MNTLEQIVSSHQCPIIRAKIMENVDKNKQYNDISELIGGGFEWYLTKEGSDFWDGVCRQFYAQYNDLKHLDNSYIPEPTPPTPKWLPIDRDNLPTEPVLCCNFDDKTKIVINRITINHLDGTIQSHNRREFFEVTHYIPLSDLLNLTIAE